MRTLRAKITTSEALLVLLLSRINDPRDIALASKLPVEEVRDILEDLVSKGFVLSRKTGIFVKRVVYDLTSKGYNEALRIYAKIKQDMTLLGELLDSGRIEDARSIISVYSNVLWLLKILRLVDERILRELL